MIVPGVCSPVNPSVDWSKLTDVKTPGEPKSFRITCYDEFKNPVTIGGL